MKEKKSNMNSKSRRISIITIFWIVFFVLFVAIISWIIYIINKNQNENEIKKIDSSIPIPEGFYFVGGTKETGFVISDNKDYYKKGISYESAKELKGNQFVWVPVENPVANNIDDVVNMAENNKFPIAYKDGENYVGVLYRFMNDYIYSPIIDKVEIREPTVLTGKIYGDLEELLEGSTGDLYQISFNKMVEGVTKHSGFYISRYEVGNLTLASKNEGKVVSKYNQSDISKSSWFNMYKSIRNMYDRDDITTEMIWGCQWDATLRWIVDTNKSSITYDNKLKGNFYNTKLNTGTNKDYVINNIYDMLGNVAEWTQAGANEEARVAYGGNYSKTTSIDDKDYETPSYLMNFLGTRMVLYMN